ncbi:MAG: type I methionyl aminopeptidase [Bacilli bacterium]
MISIKSTREIELMEISGAILGDLFVYLEPFIVPGVNTLKLSRLAENFIIERGGYPTEKGFEGFPAAICASVNDVVLHGIPSKHKILKKGDIISLDVCVTYEGYVTDACRTYPVGEVSAEAKRIIEVSKLAFFQGIALIKPGVHLGDICGRIEEVVKAASCSVLRDYTGHGVGREMHEDPFIPNYGTPGTGVKLLEGMTLAIEPMITSGSPIVEVASDGWTVRIRDGSLSSHYENTVLVTANGAKILTCKEENY